LSKVLPVEEKETEERQKSGSEQQIHRQASSRRPSVGSWKARGEFVTDRHDRPEPRTWPAKPQQEMIQQQNGWQGSDYFAHLYQVSDLHRYNGEDEQ
jgi:hypothetical protein